MGITELFGETLLSKAGETSTANALKGKTVGIYFSAHWCPPCRGFTPKLVDSYKKMTSAGKPFEIVFVSSDKDEAAFNEYYETMPWLALPFKDRDAKAKLSKKFKVQGIPMLIIVDEEGAVITADGREAVSEDPSGTSFPWHPPTLEDALGDEVLTADGDAREVSEIREEVDVLAIYFSAHWCPPCKQFTPKLGDTYEKVIASGKKMAVVFVSSDRDASSFKEYFDSMPSSWFAIPPSDKRKQQLSKRFEVEGIPRLVVLDSKTGEVINSNARGAVASDADGSAFPWRPPAVADLSEPEGINENVCVALMMEACEKTDREALVEKVTAFAKSCAKEDILFFVARSSEGPAAQVRKLTELGDATAKPQLIILDIPDDGGFYVHDGEVTAASVEAFVEAYKARKLDRKQLK